MLLTSNENLKEERQTPLKEINHLHAYVSLLQCIEPMKH